VRPYRDLFRALVRTRGRLAPEELARHLSERAVELLQVLLADPSPLIDVERTFADAIDALRVRDIERRMEEIDAERRLASDAEQDALNLEKMRLNQERAALGGPKRFGAFTRA
jgi:hypothetical protein